MNRFTLLLLWGVMTLPGIGCANHVQKQLQRQQAVFAQEYRLLEDELFLAYQELDHLQRVNESLRSPADSAAPPRRRVPQPNGNGAMPPELNPISIEGIEPSNELPQILRNRSSRRIYPLPQTYQQAQPHYSNVPVWSPQR